MRRQILAIVLSAHWAAVFGLLSFLSVWDPHFGILETVQFLGSGAAEGSVVGNAKFAALSGMTFALAAAMFLWLFVESLLGADEQPGPSVHQSCRRAIAGGACALLLFLVLVCWFQPEGDHVWTIECMLAAVLLSYLCICAEQFFCDWFAPEDVDEADAARSMALGAAHVTLLARMSGRPAELLEESV